MGNSHYGAPGKQIQARTGSPKPTAAGGAAPTPAGAACFILLRFDIRYSKFVFHSCRSACPGGVGRPVGRIHAAGNQSVRFGVQMRSKHGADLIADKPRHLQRTLSVFDGDVRGVSGVTGFHAVRRERCRVA